MSKKEALVPDDGRPPRVIRFVDDLGGLLSVYDEAQNLLIICRPVYEQLPWHERHNLERTHAPALSFEPDVKAAA